MMKMKVSQRCRFFLILDFHTESLRGAAKRNAASASAVLTCLIYPTAAANWFRQSLSLHLPTSGTNGKPCARLLPLSKRANPLSLPAPSLCLCQPTLMQKLGLSSRYRIVAPNDFY